MPQCNSAADLLRRLLTAPLCTVLFGTAALVALAPAAHAQFLYGITDGGGIYEVDISKKTTTLAFTTGLNLMNGLAFYEAGDQGAGQLFYRAGTGSTNGNAGLYVWNRRSNAQAQVTISSSVAASQTLPGQSSNGSWYNGAYWYVQQNTDTLTKVTLDLTNVNSPFVSKIDTYSNFDGTAFSSFGFGDISITSDGILYGSANDRFFQVSIVSGIPSSATYKETAMTSGSQLQIGFGTNGTLYGEAAGTGDWYTLNTTNGARTSLSFKSAQAFNDISEGSLRSAGAVVQPEPSSFALLLPLLGLGCLRRRKR